MVSPSTLTPPRATPNACWQKLGLTKRGGGGGGDVEEQGGEAVSERLRSAPAGLGVGDEPLDPGEGGVLADGVDPWAQRDRYSSCARIDSRAAGQTSDGTCA